MKKKILSMVVLMSTSLCSFAQNGVGEWSFMPKVGINFTTMTNDNDAKTRTAFTVGGEFGYVASPKVALSFGAMYSQQGCKAKFQGIDGTILDVRTRGVVAAVVRDDQAGWHLVSLCQHVLIDVTSRCGLPQQRHGVTGPVGVDAEVGLEESYKAAGMDVTLHKFDLSIPVGISYDFNNVELELRYNAGLTKILSVPGGDGTKNSVFQFTIGYKFGL